MSGMTLNMQPCHKCVQEFERRAEALKNAMFVLFTEDLLADPLEAQVNLRIADLSKLVSDFGHRKFPVRDCERHGEVLTKPCRAPQC
jgi:hypothetical protein